MGVLLGVGVMWHWFVGANLHAVLLPSNHEYARYFGG